jgi:3-dehydroquinate dehydratase
MKFIYQILILEKNLEKKSYFSDIAETVFSGHGTKGYVLALEEALKNKKV